jgi:predicted nuclease with TOPRIM domain
MNFKMKNEQDKRNENLNIITQDLIPNISAIVIDSQFNASKKMIEDNIKTID